MGTSNFETVPRKATKQIRRERMYKGVKKTNRQERPQKNANDVWLRNDESFFVRDELPFLIPFTRNKTALFS